MVYFCKLGMFMYNPGLERQNVFEFVCFCVGWFLLGVFVPVRRPTPFATLVPVRAGASGVWVLLLGCPFMAVPCGGRPLVPGLLGSGGLSVVRCVVVSLGVSLSSVWGLAVGRCGGAILVASGGVLRCL